MNRDDARALIRYALVGAVLIGAILAVPTAAILQVVFEDLVADASAD